MVNCIANCKLKKKQQDVVRSSLVLSGAFGGSKVFNLLHKFQLGWFERGSQAYQSTIVQTPNFPMFFGRTSNRVANTCL